MERSTKEIELHHVFERITDAYVALDNDWRYTFLNAKACDFFGREATDLIGRCIWDSILPRFSTVRCWPPTTAR